MYAFADRIQSLHPAISKLLEASGAPGLSLGVLHRGKIIYTAHFGRRDLDQPHSPDDNTVCYVASLTKLIAAGAIASLASEGVLVWNLPMWHNIPDFTQCEDKLDQKCTLIDLFYNRSGIEMANALWGQKYGEFLLPKSESEHTACHLEVIKPFRGSFVYSKWNYALVTAIVERVTGQTFGTYVKEKILQPLNTQRTSFIHQEGENTACPYELCYWR